MRGTHERRPSPPWPTIGAPACIVTKLAEISAYLGEFAAVPMMQEQSLSSRRNPVRISAIHVRRDKAALFQRVQVPPGDRSSRKQPEQAWR